MENYPTRRENSPNIINRNLIHEFNDVSDIIYYNQIYDNRRMTELMISHLLLSYHSNTIYNIDPNFIEEEDRSMYYSVINNIPLSQSPIEIQFICLETAEELLIPMECGICYESHPTLDFVGMNCRHVMCKSCIKACLNSKNTCPFCRETVTILDVKDPEFTLL